MNKKLLGVLAVGVALGIAGFASADSLAVTPAAALGGTNYGLEVFHDNTSVAYVQDDTPDGETVYRFTFLMRPGDIIGASTNFRQVIFGGWGTNPNPGVGLCPTNPAEYVGSIRVFLFAWGGGGQLPAVQIWGRGNWCGDQGTQRINLNANQEYRICGEYWEGPGPSGGGVAIAAVDPASACPAHGNAAYLTSNFNNIGTTVEFVRLGTPQLNGFGAGETTTLAFDEFASFRTYAP